MDKRVLDRIKKCLALGQSSNANEAAAAMRQAQKLMSAHGVSTDDVAVSDVGSSIAKGETGKTPPAHVAMLANTIATVFGTEVIYTVGIHGDRWVGRFEYFGTDGAEQVSCYAFEVLLRQLKRDRETYIGKINKRVKRATKTRRGDLYAQEWIRAAARQVVAHQRTPAQDAAIQLYKERRWSSPLKESQAIDRSDKAKHHDADAMNQGRTDGRNVSFHEGVGGRRQAVLENGNGHSA